MSRAIAIETSSRIGSVALARNGVVIAEEQFQHGLQHAAGLVPMIDRLCRAQGWSPDDVREIYVSAGPGSFTGLRIGITLAKTMALATGAKVVAVPTARVLVENAPAEARHVVVVLDARRGQIFTAFFERSDENNGVRDRLTSVKHDEDDVGDRFLGKKRPKNGDGPRFTSHWIEREPAHLDSLTAVLARAPRPVHLLGEGIPYHEKLIPADDPGVIVTPAQLWRPRAGVVARIGHAMASRGEFADIDRLSPIYLRKPEAQEKYEAAQGR